MKPKNIILDPDFNPRIRDYGLLNIKDAHFRLSPPGDLKDVEYIAPEIIKGGVPSTQIDLFGLGCVAFYIWQGSHAFLRDTDFLTWKAILEEPTPTIAVHTQQEAKYLSLVQACLEKDPEKRLCAERFLEKMG